MEPKNKPFDTRITIADITRAERVFGRSLICDDVEITAISTNDGFVYVGEYRDRIASGEYKGSVLRAGGRTVRDGMDLFDIAISAENVGDGVIVSAQIPLEEYKRVFG